MNTEITMGMDLLLCSGTLYDNLQVTLAETSKVTIKAKKKR